MGKRQKRLERRHRRIIGIGVGAVVLAGPVGVVVANLNTGTDQENEIPPVTLSRNPVSQEASISPTIPPGKLCTTEGKVICVNFKVTEKDGRIIYSTDKEEANIPNFAEWNIKLKTPIPGCEVKIKSKPRTPEKYTGGLKCERR